MRGIHRVVIQSAHLKYELEFSRNITVIQGDSASGKTTLVDMINAYYENPVDSGISLQSACPLRVLGGANWQEQLAMIRGSIVFIDEGNRFPGSADFARAIQGTDNYYVIITRESLDVLPYSVTEIYGIHSSGKFQSMEPVYHHLYRIYAAEQLHADNPADRWIVEDSNAGFDFYAAVAKEAQRTCVSAGGAARIFDLLQQVTQGENCIVIADGAAFGSQMGKIYQLMLRNSGIRLYLPESFEWLILSSNVLDDSEVRKILDQPSDYIDSGDYISWERFFTALLIEKTKDTYLAYRKAGLNSVYLKGNVYLQLKKALPWQKGSWV